MEPEPDSKQQKQKTNLASTPQQLHFSKGSSRSSTSQSFLSSPASATKHTPPVLRRNQQHIHLLASLFPCCSALLLHPKPGVLAQQLLSLKAFWTDNAHKENPNLMVLRDPQFGSVLYSTKASQLGPAYSGTFFVARKLTLPGPSRLNSELQEVSWLESTHPPAVRPRTPRLDLSVAANNC